MDLKESGERMPQQIALKSTINGTNIVLLVRNIIYISTFGSEKNHIYVYYVSQFDGRLQCVSVRSTLKDIFEVLPNQFCWANRSDIYNLRYVSAYDNDNIMMWTPDGVKTLPNLYKYIFQYIVEL